MMRLDDYEKRLLAAKEGRLKQICLENILRYAEVLGAEELCEVTKATVFCGAHNYLNVKPSDTPDEVFSRMNLAADAINTSMNRSPRAKVSSKKMPSFWSRPAAPG